ncbi:GyrI-like domain-containing protein [Lysinibacillus sp. SGAir0095]|uniref:AraC family transcriptional regulator n=1 Tax=Lysinibacillus sp. SGAir0095 TaxID=2070463 RepID=UPI0010CD3867|nr:GyrI-like domain-containing protein [Lysinibacillus sp. SGAir0095]QCR31157.1 AraC family transcriptional regulator [Lysinibacillus sp. SGAir0095]
MNIEFTELEDYEVAYIRRTGSYFEVQEHWGRLIDWAMTNGLFPPHQSFIGISLDNPDLVEPNQCRHDACVTIPESFEKEKHPDVQFRKLDGGLYALHSFYDTPEKLNGVYQYMFGQWLPHSEYESDNNRFPLEFNMNNLAEDPEGKCKVDLYVPIKKKIYIK